MNNNPIITGKENIIMTKKIAIFLTLLLIIAVTFYSNKIKGQEIQRHLKNTTFKEYLEKNINGLNDVIKNWSVKNTDKSSKNSYIQKPNGIEKKTKIYFQGSAKFFKDESDFQEETSKLDQLNADNYLALSLVDEQTLIVVFGIENEAVYRALKILASRGQTLRGRIDFINIASTVNFDDLNKVAKIVSANIIGEFNDYE